MPFSIRMGLPEMADFWNDISSRKLAGKLGADEEKFFKKIIKTLNFLAQNPGHNSLRTHEIDTLSRKYGLKVYQSYFENNTPAAGRLFWAYGPDRGDITILGIEPHPESGAYSRVKLSGMPPAKANKPRHK